jgi:enterochelin esterase-like enzyme
LVEALADYIDGGRVKFFCVGSNSHDSFLNKGAHPYHRSWRQRLFDEYIRNEVVPFIRTHCESGDIAISTMGASLGAYHAANTLFRYPNVVKRCYALSGVYDLRSMISPISATRGTSSSSPPARSVSPPARVRGKTAARPISCQRCCRERASVTTWTTGARREGTTGPTGSIRCGSIWRGGE